MKATLDLVVEVGAANLSIDGVAARAGVGKATIYRRWPSREALVLDAISTDATIIKAADTGSLRGDLDAYFAELIERLANHRGSDVLPHLIEAACHDPDVRASLDRYMHSRQQPLRAVLERAQARGEIGATVDLEVLVEALIGAVMYRRLFTGDPIDSAFVSTLLATVL